MWQSCTFNLFVYICFITIVNIQNPLQIVTSNLFKDTHREKAPSNRTPQLAKIMNMEICVVGSLNQLFIRSSETETKLKKNKVVINELYHLTHPPTLSHAHPHPVTPTYTYPHPIASAHTHSHPPTLTHTQSHLPTPSHTHP